MSATAASIQSIPRVCDVELVCGSAAAAGGAPDLLIEVPHGATRAAHFDALRAEMRGDLPADLRDFFFVNTDVGAPEVASRLAAQVAAAFPSRSVLVLRCLIPRTFVDCNRVIDADTKPQSSEAGGVTPGIASYLKDPRDTRLAFERYSAYRSLAERAYETVCGAGGTALMLHTYAPRSIDVPVDERIVERLRAEYASDRIERWPLRAEADLITRTPEGVRWASDALVGAVRSAFVRAGVACAVDATYALHPQTLGSVFAARYPGRTLCLEIRRDLLVESFTPFAEMDVRPDRADRLAAALAEGLATLWPKGPRGNNV